MEFNITKNAKEKLFELKEQNLPIKISVTYCSCCGMEYHIVTDKKEENDEICNVDDIELILPEKLKYDVKRIDIDFNEVFEVVPMFA